MHALSLRVRLLLLVVLAASPAFIAITYNAHSIRQDALADSQVELAAVAQLVATSQERVVEGVRQLLTALSKNPETRATDITACTNYFKDLKEELKIYTNFGVLDARGYLKCHAVPMTGSTYAGDRGYFRDALRTGGFSVGGYQIGRATKTQSINFGYPIRNSKGGIEGIVFTGIDLAELAKIPGDIKLGSGTTWAVTDTDGKILADYPFRPEMLGKTIFAPAENRTGIRTTSSVKQIVAEDGKPYLRAVHGIEQFSAGHLTIYVSRPLGAILTPIEQDLLTNLFWLSMITLAMAAIAWRFGDRSIREPLRQLSALTEKVAAGDYSVRSGLHDQRNEMGRLGSALDGMISKLAEQRDAENLRRKELQESEEKYRLFFSANPVPMWVYDRKTLAFLAVNDAALKTYGYTRQEFLGKTLPDIIAEEDHPLMRSRIDMPMFYDNLKMVRHRWHDGTLRNVIATRQEITYAGREARLVYPRDVTEQFAAMQRLEEQQRLLEAILESTGEAIVACDEEGRLTFFNRAARKLHGSDVRSVAMSALPENYDLFQADGVTPMTAEEVPLLRALKGEALSRVEMVVAPKGKKPRTLLATASQVTDREGHILGAVVSMHDITEKKQAEEQLKKSEERFRKLFYNASVGMVICNLIRDQNGRIVDYTHVQANKAMETHTGITEKDVIGKRCSEVIPPEETAPFIKMLTKVLETGTPYTYQQHFASLGRTIENRPIMIEDDIFALTFFDVTQSEQAVKALKLTTERMKGLSHQLLRVQEDERKAIAMELHDEVGQALSAIKLNLNFAARAVHDEAVLKKLAGTVQITDTVLAQVRDLSLNLRPPQLDLMGLGAALRALLERTAAAAGLALQFEADLDLARDPWVEIACFRVAQEAMTNIIRHAKAKTVSVELGEREGELRLRIRDDGIGFKPHDANAEVAQGMSMGLLGMQERTLLAGGSFEIVSAPGAGTEVRANFPIAAATGARAAGQEAVQ